MDIGCFQVAFVEVHFEALPKEDAEAGQRLLYLACTGVNPGDSSAPDGEEYRALSLRGRRWAHYWPMPQRTPNGKPLLP